MIGPAVLNLAEASGATITSEPAYPGSALTARYAEPLAGIRAAATVQCIVTGLAAQEVDSYIRRARSAGTGWLDIGKALGLEDPGHAGYDIAVAAFEQAAGPRSGMDPLNLYFTCGSCGKTIADHGPYGGHPLDLEDGHADSCTRMAAAVAAYERQWDEDDSGTGHDDSHG
jgi:hypothetical protein